MCEFGFRSVRLPNARSSPQRVHYHPSFLPPVTCHLSPVTFLFSAIQPELWYKIFSRLGRQFRTQSAVAILAFGINSSRNLFFATMRICCYRPLFLLFLISPIVLLAIML